MRGTVYVNTTPVISCMYDVGTGLWLIQYREWRILCNEEDVPRVIEHMTLIVSRETGEGV